MSCLKAISDALPPVRGYPIKEVIALPIAPSGEVTMNAVLVVGLNPLREFDDAYQCFLELVSGGISSAITRAGSCEAERRCAEALAEVDRAKTAFFSNVSHEFRTPLTLLLGPLEDELRERPASNKRLTIAHRNALRLLKLINGLLDFSSIEAGHIETSYEPTDLGTLTGDLASVFRSAIEKAGLRFSVVCPRLSDDVYVDREMWEKIVLNLLSNAFRFTLEGEITVALCGRHGRAELSVSDTGVGIPASELHHVFEPFHRIGCVQSRVDGGTGIGLALARELVKLHGGDITVQSVEGRGTTFTVAIPLGTKHLPKERIGAARKQAVTASGPMSFLEDALRCLPNSEMTTGDPTEEVKRPAPTASCAGKLGRILLADDNADMCDYLRGLLAPQYDVIAAPDGEAAFAAACEQQPDLVVSDELIPRLDGYGLVDRLRQHPRTSSLPVVLLSACASEKGRMAGLEHGADDYMIEPFTARELLARISTHLRLAKARKAAERILRDDTERQRASEAVLQRQRLESVGLLAGGIAHDFNNLLTGIMGNASLIVEQMPPGAAKRVREIIRSAERAAQLTRQLLAYSGKGRAISQEVDVSDAVSNLGALVEFSIPKSVELALAVQKRLPPVQTDPGQLQQILMNLVINAGEAIGAGTPGKITVTTSVADVDTSFVDALGQEIVAGRYVSIEVQDTGSGIDDQSRARIFDPFYTTKSLGRGLGLAAVAGIIRLQRGAITLESVPGRGSTFRILLPVISDAMQELEDQPARKSHGTILVVDDERSVREFIGAVLRQQGYRVVLASDGREALTVCDREGATIHAVVLDVVMPSMGAKEFLPVFGARHPEAKIMLTSGYDEAGARQLCDAYPDAAFIQKPYTAQQIASEMRRLLGMTRL